MAVGFRSPLAPLGLSKPKNTDVGYRGLLAFWCGGATSVTPTGAQGYRGMLAFWAGGAGSVTPTSTQGYRSLLAHWLGGAGVGQFTPTQEAPPKTAIRRPPTGYTQRGKLWPFEQPDEYRELHARGIYRSTLEPFHEAEQYGSSAVAAIYRGQMVASTHADEYAQLLARRGLPNKHALHLLFNEIHFELCGAIMRKGKS
jgi:hypothetical protein